MLKRRKTQNHPLPRRREREAFFFMKTLQKVMWSTKNRSTLKLKTGEKLNIYMYIPHEYGENEWGGEITPTRRSSAAGHELKLPSTLSKLMLPCIPVGPAMVRIASR
jgi:hypothetical protein